jgi:hypothetical protein
MCASMPASARRSANQLQPYVASKTTLSERRSSSPKTRWKSSGRLATRRLSTTVPSSASAVTTDRLR